MKISVIGCPGSSKSTFSIKLSEILNIPVIHIDNLFWNSDKTFISREELKAKLTEAMEADSWIMDGNYSSTMGMRLAESDRVIFLNIDLKTCTDAILNRIGKVRPDLPY